ncbi:permease [Pontivivens nitratireducens]|uniref:Permease n=1 Tax=Pontivivens nitratireducens TaxID=2758038 RepID=A0A6G7VPM2_9RHOB|nr:permease [Pontibrevibacter nitratireducens]QIK41808.1 permease [Pontibrevibacter nitratireducens]
MIDTAIPHKPNPTFEGLKRNKVWLASITILILLAILSPAQARFSLAFTLDALLHTAPFLILSIAIAAWAGATGADSLIARVFTGSPLLMIGLAALAGGLSPFCSCGVIPLIAALLSMGVPLSAVMAFWLASPIMDPSMFVLTTGVLGTEFAIAKTLAAIGLGVMGGLVIYLLARGGALADPLRAGIGNGGCGASNLRTPQPVVWKFWTAPERRAKFGREAVKTTLFLAKWLVLAFLLESLMLTFVPAEVIANTLGGTGIGPIALATVVGVPAYLNGYAALPLIGGMLEQGMAPGAGLAFLVAGGVTSLPAAIAVWALVRPKVFTLYIALSLSGAFLCGLLFQTWMGS